MGAVALLGMNWCNLRLTIVPRKYGSEVHVNFSETRSDGRPMAISKEVLEGARKALVHS